MLFNLTACHKDRSRDDDHGVETVLYQTNFDGVEDDWGTGDDTDATRSVDNGYYNVYNKSATDYYFSYTNVMFYGLSDYMAVEAKIKISGGNTDYQAFGGLTYNYRLNGNQLYVFGFYNDGYFEIFGYDTDGNFIEIKEATATNALVKNGTNVLRIQQDNGTMHYYINNTEVYNEPVGNTTLDLTGFYADPETTTSVDYYKAVKF